MGLLKFKIHHRTSIYYYLRYILKYHLKYGKLKKKYTDTPICGEKSDTELLRVGNCLVSSNDAWYYAMISRDSNHQVSNLLDPLLFILNKILSEC